DSNLPLLKSMLEGVKAAAKSNAIHYDYVVLSGDLLAHQFDESYRRCVNGDAAAYTKFTSDTIKFVDGEISRALPGIPVFTALGNNDTDNGDYGRPTPDFLREVGLDWSHSWGVPNGPVRQAAIDSFSRSGFYEAPNPAAPSQEIVVLNSNLWVARNSSACGSS